MSQHFIKIQNLTKSYIEADKQNIILNNISVVIEQKEIVVLLGKSGSGKSTLLNLLSGIDLPDSGEIVLDGINITGLNENDRTLFRRNSIGFVFQFFNLIPTLSVIENLLLPLELKSNIGKKEYDKALELLDLVGLADTKNRFPDTLSGGEQQRIAIARALIHNPELILADEPTGNLDFETGLHIIELLDTMVRKFNKTMLIATHSKEVSGIADKIYTIRDGTLLNGKN